MKHILLCISAITLCLVSCTNFPDELYCQFTKVEAKNIRFVYEPKEALVKFDLNVSFDASEEEILKEATLVVSESDLHWDREENSNLQHIDFVDKLDPRKGGIVPLSVRIPYTNDNWRDYIGIYTRFRTTHFEHINGESYHPSPCFSVKKPLIKDIVTHEAHVKEVTPTTAIIEINYYNPTELPWNRFSYSIGVVIWNSYDTFKKYVDLTPDMQSRNSSVISFLFDKLSPNTTYHCHLIDNNIGEQYFDFTTSIN